MKVASDKFATAGEYLRSLRDKDYKKSGHAARVPTYKETQARNALIAKNSGTQLSTWAGEMDDDDVAEACHDLVQEHEGAENITTRHITSYLNEIGVRPTPRAVEQVKHELGI